MKQVWEWINSLWSWVVWLRNRLTTDEVRFSQLEAKVKKMSDILDTLKADFESYKAAVDAKLVELGEKIKGQLDPDKAAAIDAGINAARAELNPPSA